MAGLTGGRGHTVNPGRSGSSGIGSNAHYGGQGMGSYPSGTVSSKSYLKPASAGDPYS